MIVESSKSPLLPVVHEPEHRNKYTPHIIHMITERKYNERTLREAEKKIIGLNCRCVAHHVILRIQIIT